MSGPRGFHHSQGDATRSFAGSRALGYEKTRGGMAGILSHDNIESRAPPPRDSGSMAALLEQEAPEAPPTARTQQARSAMDDVMQGVGQIGVDDSRYGIGRRTLNEAHMGAGALAVLRGEEAEKGMDDPFSMSRKPKVHPRDLPPPAPAPLPPVRKPMEKIGGPPAGADSQERALFGQLMAVHDGLNAAAASAPREAPEDPRLGRGRLVDYRPLLAHLASHGIALNADAAGTLSTPHPSPNGAFALRLPAKCDSLLSPSHARCLALARSQSRCLTSKVRSASSSLWIASP